jgi:hypothetical protein
MSPCRYDLPGGAVQGKGLIAVPLSTRGGGTPSDAAPAKPRVFADPATSLEGQKPNDALLKGGVSTAQVPASLAKGQSSVISERGNASTTPIPAFRAGLHGVPIPKEDASAGLISHSSGKVEDGTAPDKGVPKAVKTVVMSQTPTDRPAPAGNSKSPGEKEITAAELAPKPWSFSPTAQVAGPDTMTRPNPVPLAKAQSHTPQPPVIPVEKGPVSRPAVTVPEGASESAKKMPASAPQVTTTREHVGTTVSHEAPKVTPESQPHGKLEKMPVLDKPITPPHMAGPSLVSRYLDNRHVSPSGREAAVRHVVSAGVNQTTGKEVDSSATHDGIHAVPQFSVPEGAESVAVQRATMHIAAPVGGESASVKTPAQSVSEQILDSIRGSITRGEQQLSIRLRPPELGSVCVRFAERNEQIHAVLEVDRPDTRREIERALPDVLQSLHDLGVPIRKLEVTTGETPQREPGREQLPQDSWQQGSDRSRDESQRAGSAGRPAYYDGPSQTVADSPETAAVTTGGPADRIDMLM